LIVIIDYGMGNLFSIQSALHYLGAQSIISSDPHIIHNADKLILPGVGSFHKAMTNLMNNNLIEVIKAPVIKKKTPLLGICLGMQLLGSSSTEDGFSYGLGFIDCPVERFSETKYVNLKIPHVGFDTVTITKNSKLFQGLDSSADFYFTHSYRMAFTEQECAIGTCAHGEQFIAAFEKGNICGTQFHPEKSQTNGLVLLNNFIEIF
jgi:imidazole glycerol-phosphate synthase subunit HisH